MPYSVSFKLSLSVVLLTTIAQASVIPAPAPDGFIARTDRRGVMLPTGDGFISKTSKRTDPRAMMPYENGVIIPIDRDIEAFERAIITDPNAVITSSNRRDYPGGLISRTACEGPQCDDLVDGFLSGGGPRDVIIPPVVEPATGEAMPVFGDRSVTGTDPEPQDASSMRGPTGTDPEPTEP